MRGQPKVLPLAGRRGAILTGGLVSVALSVARRLRLAVARQAAELPGVTRRVALPYTNGGVRTFLQPSGLVALGQRSPAPPALAIIGGRAHNRNWHQSENLGNFNGKRQHAIFKVSQGFHDKCQGKPQVLQNQRKIVKDKKSLTSAKCAGNGLR
jgi:hypothetical protein